MILKNINLSIAKNEIHVLMGPNGSGKSTLAQAVMGSKNYELKGKNYELRIDGKNIKNLKTDERAREGLFLAFQNPISIPGVSIADLLKTAYQQASSSKVKKLHNPILSVWEFNELLVNTAKKLKIPQEFLRRNLDESFSGGEKKKLEMLTVAILRPKYAIFDEIDTGLDVDALKIIAHGISKLKAKGTGILLITHYQRLLRFVKPDFVHILVDGQIVESGRYKLAEKVEKNGYKRWTDHQSN
jgi:Fe-S cluster assembly ATP-binding protein